ncbi:MAG: class I SAM-dependent methyltransferase [Actinobacteria bacterium]|nr:class I SAM-dependent methyltransferase [Actinomycetota bacterium]
MATQEIDETKSEAFAGRMMEVLNGGFLSLQVSVGYQAGLFETLAELPPSRSAQIAEAAGLNERYVREWLAGMTVGGIVEYDPNDETFRLPPEHAAFVTKAAGPNDMAFFTRYVGLCGLVEDDVLEAFRTGAGVPYEKYPDFQRIQGEESARTYDATLIEGILPLAKGLPERLAAGIDVLDVGCGVGHALNLMAKAYPASRFVGYDFAEDGVAAGCAGAAALGLENARFEARNVHEFDEPEAYDLVTAFDVVHDLAHPSRVLEQVERALRPGGTFLMVEIAASSRLENNIENPLGPLLYGASIFHCMSVSLAQGGEGHGTCWGEENATAALEAARFVDIEAKRVEDDPFHAVFVAHKA